MSADLSSIQCILWQFDGDDRPSLEFGRRTKRANSELTGNSSKTSSLNRQKRNAESILSLADAMYTECAVDADALGFMAKMLVQTTLPHRAQPGKQYTRADGDVTLSITDIGNVGFPYGAYPRFILVWMTTEALRTGERRLELGRSLSGFMGQLGLQCTGGIGEQFRGLGDKWSVSSEPLSPHDGSMRK